MSLAIFIGKRLAAGVVLLVVLSFLVFGLLAISPGSPIQTLLGDRTPTPQLIAALTAAYHLNDPFFVQYGNWLYGILHLSFGTSISIETNVPVTTIIEQRMTLSAELAAYALVLVLALGIPLGLAAGIRRGRPADRVISLAATFGISAPAFVLSIGLLYVFGVALGWFPVYGIGTGFAQRVVHLTLPAVALAAFLSAIVIRQTRAAALTVMQSDFVTFARIRGLSRRRILVGYALRNAALPVVTSAGILLIAALSAGVFVEQVFSLPGVGSLLLTSVTNKDIPVVQGAAMATGAFVVVVNLLVDVLALFIDPRTRYRSVRGG